MRVDKGYLKSIFSPHIKKLICFCSLAALTVLLSSCATVAPPPVQQAQLPQGPICSVLGNNIIHTVAAGETLWRISRMYGVSVKDVMRANNLKEPILLEKGQQLVIPNIATTKTVVPLFPSTRWKYIIIHHSATDDGDAYAINILHRRRGWNEIGYDFVIDNGTKGRADGAIEVSPRWTNQETGAHCRSSDMNNIGIGICLVGNFSKEKVSEKQLNSLVYLVNVLKKYYEIPINHIMGHGQVPGARTECPGKYFPWREFRERLANCS